MRVLKTMRLVKRGSWIVYGWYDTDGVNILAGKVKTMGDGSYSFCRKGFMANKILWGIFGDADDLRTAWEFPYMVGNGKDGAVVFLCDDEEELRTAFLSVVL